MSLDEVYRHLREYRDELVPPPGFAQPEISGGQILMMTSPSRAHDLNALRIRRQLDSQLTGDLVAVNLGDVEDVSLGKLRRPDVLVVPESAFEADSSAEDARGIDPHVARLVVEIVSPTSPENDYEGKLRDYPAMGVPHYLIVDPRQGACVHHWHIGVRNGVPVYEGTAPYTFGDKITLGEWTLDTSELRRYRPESA
ncbi:MULTISPECIES: Uma2 family endonuclease [Streptomyces]|uniref:Uma2 family endonuclease n=1 Tax=Streptomyces TaxID=1883 RepID=UPI00163CC43C|nr:MULTISPECIES: Uma2 family endonuclease [Streptomyces]MBC2875928.1 Uma2 family endonuclease [Streptomyces sp. TYQ1024]UBI38301.1 Uma2 family endonuclease [Streptomyces mobaraensis]UKW30886.1 Uma2 family endonuclease [Streptomyces sp. TYQ1024]